MTQSGQMPEHSMQSVIKQYGIENTWAKRHNINGTKHFHCGKRMVLWAKGWINHSIKCKKHLRRNRYSFMCIHINIKICTALNSNASLRGQILSILTNKTKNKGGQVQISIANYVMVLKYMEQRPSLHELSISRDKPAINAPPIVFNLTRIWFSAT